MKCPHCFVEFHAEFQDMDHGRGHGSGDDLRAATYVQFTTWCPSCNQPTMLLSVKWIAPGNRPRELELRMYPPRRSDRAPVPTEVDDPALAEDYREACEVLPISPKASAALSRRCLQHILRERAGIQKHSLVEQIQVAIDSGKLPTHLSDNLDYVRHVGNFAAHPMKSASTGEILPVEADEAAWNLDVIEGLFDFYYVGPARQAAKRAELNKKLAEAKKPPLK